MSRSQDENLENNTAEGFLANGGKSRVPPVTPETPGLSRPTPLAVGLMREEIEVATRSSNDLPERADELRDHGLVILMDVPVVSDSKGHSLTACQMEALKPFVEETGGGLLVMGGAHSFGPGG